MAASTDGLLASFHKLLAQDKQTRSTTGSPLVLRPPVTEYDTATLQRFTTSLTEALQGPEDYTSRLDSGLSGVLNLQPSSLHHDHAQLVGKATALVRRFPTVPARIAQTPYLHRHQYFVAPRVEDATGGGRPSDRRHIMGDMLGDDYDHYAQEDDTHNRLWTGLVKDWPPSSNTLRIALAVADTLASPDISIAQTIRQYVSFTGDLNRVLQNQALHRTRDREAGLGDREATIKAEALVIWESYVSICWQHGRMLLFYYILAAIFQSGWSRDWGTLFAVHDVDDSNWVVNINQPKYLCSQALALLHRSKGCSRHDSRLLFSCFADLFGDRPGRCDPHVPNYVCDGMIARSCARFYGQPTADQSMHDMACDRTLCHRIPWDPVSYDGVASGSRAVDFGRMRTTTTDSHHPRLLYRRADGTTLAVSHVWSHGQGGRPETGFNSCLHRRYARIAREHGCSSYWIDTCCIPTDDRRRMEAIRGINGVFEGSKVTLVCDQDVMQVPPGRREHLLAVLLVADWNVRAWTLLEGLRGRWNISLLVAGNVLVSLATLYGDVFDTGTLDAVVMLGAMQHLLPSARLSYEESGFLLGRRTASRAGDETIIWGLLATNSVTRTAEALVDNLTHVHTGFLVSKMPRIRRRGLGWAPTVAHLGNDFSGSDGDGSAIGTRTAEGLRATWLVHHIDNAPRYWAGDDLFYRSQFPLAILVEWVGRDGPSPRERYQHLAVLHPKSVDSDDPYLGQAKHPAFRFVVLCGSNDRVAWHWIEVTTIETSLANVPEIKWTILSLDHFRPEHLLLV